MPRRRKPAPPIPEADEERDHRAYLRKVEIAEPEAAWIDRLPREDRELVYEYGVKLYGASIRAGLGGTEQRRVWLEAERARRQQELLAGG